MIDENELRLLHLSNMELDLYLHQTTTTTLNIENIKMIYTFCNICNGSLFFIMKQVVSAFNVILGPIFIYYMYLKVKESKVT